RPDHERQLVEQLALARRHGDRRQSGRGALAHGGREGFVLAHERRVEIRVDRGPLVLHGVPFRARGADATRKRYSPAAPRSYSFGNSSMKTRSISRITQRSMRAFSE